MLDFLKEANRVVLTYTGEMRGSSWIYSELADNGSVTLRRTFTVSQKELISEQDPENEEAPVKFDIAAKAGEYYRFSKDVLGINNDLFVHEDVQLTSKTFIAVRIPANSATDSEV